MNFKRITILYLILCWVVVLGVILLSPMPEISPHITKITFYDKGIHFILFGIFSYLIIIFLLTFKRIIFQVGSLITLISVTGVIYLAEYFQIFIPGRSASALDFLSGFLGLVLAFLAHKYHK